MTQNKRLFLENAMKMQRMSISLPNIEYGKDENGRIDKWKIDDRNIWITSF